MPWYLVRLTLGFGTSAASRAMKSIVRMAAPSKATCVVPSL
jgi:hypothetical protein